MIIMFTYIFGVLNPSALHLQFGHDMSSSFVPFGTFRLPDSPQFLHKNSIL